MNFTIGKHTTTQEVYFCDKVDCFYFSRKRCPDIHILPSQFPYPVDIANSAHTYHALVAATTTTQIKPPGGTTTPINISNPSTVTTTTINTTTPGYSEKYPQTNLSNTFLISFVTQHLIVLPCFQ